VSRIVKENLRVSETEGLICPSVFSLPMIMLFEHCLFSLSYLISLAGCACVYAHSMRLSFFLRRRRAMRKGESE
jgi:hypothetical protein